MSGQKRQTAYVTAEQIDEAFDNGENMEKYFDFDKMELQPPVNIVVKSLGLSLPNWLVNLLDEEADRRAISRKALINVILVDWADNLQRQREGRRA